MPRYNPAQIEPKWQQYWEQHHTFRTPEMPEGEKLYVLDMFPYPSGAGLHVGHPEGYTATDIVCRYSRMKGISVLHPMGFDAFGLPAEEHAIKTNTHPRVSTEKNISTFKRQLKMLGFSYDWDRELATTDIDYVKWTQWIFLQLFNTWFDPERQKGRPIAELPIPEEVRAEGETAVRRYQNEHRLAYESAEMVNWCPGLGTVVANEEVIDGRSERGDHPVERRPLRQWMLRITAYADRLMNDLDTLNWPEGIRQQQREWIGRSVGAEVDFFIGSDDQFAAWQQERASGGFPKRPDQRVLRIYTTRPDTLYGATYMVIAPEHPLVDALTTDAQRVAVEKYRRVAASKSDRERQQTKEKTGVFTGSFAINPVNGQPTPVWISDYVLISYGTGAIMAVPAHDDRDFEFATAFGIPVIAVVDPGQDVGPEMDRDAVLRGEQCFVGKGLAVNSGPYDGRTTDEFKAAITESLASGGCGRAAVNYKLRDWLFSRQRFWGEPFPLLHELDDNGEPTGLYRAVDESELPVDLPQLEDYKPHGRPEPLLAKAPDDWQYVERDGKRYRRELNTMPQWAGSCWYYLRYIDPHNDQCMVDRAKEQAWMPVDLYVGGAEHAVLHLLYSRFWHKVLFDRGHVSTPEPFSRLVNQGIILGETEHSAWRLPNGNYVPAKEVNRDRVHEPTGVEAENVKLTDEELESIDAKFVESKAHKMSKARGNVVNPDDVVRDYGADALRLYEMFMGPLEATKPWNMEGVNGVRNFLDRAWRMIIDYQAEQLQLAPPVKEVELTRDQAQCLHATIQAVTRDTEAMSFNTAIARMMEFVNFFTPQDVRPQQAMETFVLLLAPYAPHIAEELWAALGHASTLAHEPWPAFDESLAQKDTVEVPIQICGKFRTTIEVPTDLDREQLEAAALADERVQALLADRQIVKTIVVPGRMVNFVIK
ncbi:MAG: leucine--tRNA ligase [Planctomycetales bacterium]|nr:leucine--tRNA ligase [Planctomycetales bacterium]